MVPNHPQLTPTEQRVFVALSERFLPKGGKQERIPKRTLVKAIGEICAFQNKKEAEHIFSELRQRGLVVPHDSERSTTLYFLQRP